MTVTTGDLATYLNDPSIDTARAQKFIDRSVTLCESVISPLPTEADVVVERMAGRAYLSAVGPRARQVTAAGSPFGPMPNAGTVYLTADDRADLRRLAGGGSAFSIDTLPVDYTLPDAVVADEALDEDWDSPV